MSTERHPAISIVAAIYNGAADVERACRSVLDQTFRDFELVIVDDASTDATPEIVAALRAADPRVRYVRNDAQKGQTWSLNRGLELSRGTYIARIDADDSFRPQKLERQMAYLAANPGIDVLGTWAMRVDQNGGPVGLFRAPLTREGIDLGLLNSSPICHVSVLMRRSAVSAVGGYRIDYRYSADFKLWSDLRRAGYALANMAEVLVDYRVATTTFGGASRLGAAAAETAAIIQENARDLHGVDLDLAVCRAIHLRAEAASDLTEAERWSAFVAMADLTRRVYGSLSMRVRARLLAAAAWSFAIHSPATPADSERARRALRSTASMQLGGLRVARAAGRVTRRIGANRVQLAGALIRRGLHPRQ